MIRVTFAEREPEDVPANRATTTADGSLVLEWAEIGETYDSKTLQRYTVITGLAWVKTFSRATGWLTAEPVAAADSEGTVAAVKEESTVARESELEEAIR